MSSSSIADFSAQIRVTCAPRHGSDTRSVRPSSIELIIDAKLQTKMSAFEVLTPPNPEYHQLVSTIHAPILLVIGDTGVVSLQTARELQKFNPRLQLEQIPDVGHGLPYDQPDRFAAVVKSFLRAVTVS